MTNKLYGFDFFKSIGSPKLVLAPMVDQSELAWRLLGRKYGATLAFTPMFHAANFIRDKSYRQEAMEFDSEDRPLIYQFCSNDPETFTAAAKLVEDHCDAVDLNLGCPQSIAKRGHYGSYLQEEWELISKMLTKCVKELKVPVTAKIRALETVEMTVEYAKMIESCGVSMLTIHGRKREQRGINTGLADWNVIKAVKDALSIPVIANGNIQYYTDIQNCMEATGADGFMSAEGHLHNPGIFTPESPKYVWEMAYEYLQLAKLHPCNISYSRGHVFKLLHHALHCHSKIRELISSAKHIDDLINAVNELNTICGPDNCQSDIAALASLPYKHWFCQPYIRPPVSTNIKRVSDDEEVINADMKRGKSDAIEIENQSIAEIYPSIALNKSKCQRTEEKKKKKEARQLCIENKAKKGRQESNPCVTCVCNTRGLKCQYQLCKSCCKTKRIAEKVVCAGHIVVWHSDKLDKIGDNNQFVMI